jgi:hypothetical protein
MICSVKLLPELHHGCLGCTGNHILEMVKFQCGKQEEAVLRVEQIRKLESRNRHNLALPTVRLSIGRDDPVNFRDVRHWLRLKYPVMLFQK